MAGALDELVAAVMRGWATVARSWIEAANAIAVGWLDLADVESGITGFNEEVVLVPPQQGATPLRLGPFTDWDHNQLPDAALTLVPGQVKAGQTTQTSVVVEPPEDTASGTYTGSLYDPNGTCVVADVGVYVVGDRAP